VVDEGAGIDPQPGFLVAAYDEVSGSEALGE
jgi:hypothetical protein